MNKFIGVLLVCILVILPLSLAAAFYYMDKVSFLCPIGYRWDIQIRNDSRGEGSFAARRNGGRTHQGLDLFADLNTPVVACGFGKARVLEQKNGMGNYIIIRHAHNLTTLYGHLSKVEIRDGAWVRQGQVIGRVGKTGNADHPDMQPHLHFEVRIDGAKENPMDCLN